MLKRVMSVFSPPSDNHLQDQYRQMHAKRAFPGGSWKAHFPTLRECIPEIDTLRVVDFGCGPNGGLAEFLPDNVIPYDPYVESYNQPPWNIPFDVLFSSDVLEHVPLRGIRDLLEKTAKCAPQYVFFNVSTRMAYKRLPDGTNAHLTVKPARWWLETSQRILGTNYEPIHAREDLLRSEITLCMRRSDQ